MKSFTTNDIERSLFLRSANNMLDMLEKLYFYDSGLSEKEKDHYKDGAGNFLCAMIKISQNNRYKGGTGMSVPFVVYAMVEA